MTHQISSGAQELQDCAMNLNFIFQEYRSQASTGS